MNLNLIPFWILMLAFSSTWCQAESTWYFNRIASFPTSHNLPKPNDRETVAEIIAVSDDGMTLIYTDGSMNAVGRIDIRDPYHPMPMGLTDVGGEPTSVTVIGDRGYVAVNTSKNYTETSGKLVTIDLKTGLIASTVDLGGQPDSTAHDDHGTFLAIAIENERNEKAGNGRVPQLPAGWVTILPIEKGLPNGSAAKRVDLCGLAEIAPEDPEPEFVDINNRGEIVVTLQENNHIVVIAEDGRILNHFSAGTVDLDRIDAADDGALAFTDTQPRRLREPDSVQWIDRDHFLTCNEGDMDGGSRSFTIFSKTGEVVFESNSSFETPIIHAGHYPDKRSDAKGVEPEGLECARFGDHNYAFILAERASTMSVYDITSPGHPVFKQLLPTGVGPEGAIAIPLRNLVVVSSEVDFVNDDGSRAHVMLYEYQPAPPTYPQISSQSAGSLIGWGAISGMVAADESTVHFVSDSFYQKQPTIFTVDTSQTPAAIINNLIITRDGAPAMHLDLEGIALDGAGGYWLASEGRLDRHIPHAIYHADKEGKIRAEIPLPIELLQHETRYGIEGITRVGHCLWMAFQREWKDDSEGYVKLVCYDLKSNQWGAVHYPLHRPHRGWAGLSEIVAHGQNFYVIERDNQVGENAATKKIYRISASDMIPAPLGGPLPVVRKTEVYDLLPDLQSMGGYVAEKVEGLAIFPDGRAWVATDNDGVDDNNGETRFWSIGTLD